MMMEEDEMDESKKDFYLKHKREFDEEERIHQAEQQLETTKKIMKGKRMPEPC